jgi:hypothetical protein
VPHSVLLAGLHWQTLRLALAVFENNIIAVPAAVVPAVLLCYVKRFLEAIIHAQQASC